jgi:membrane protein implicated in regulation of membrane protease activity
MGIAAGLVGLLLLVIPGMPIELQLILFAVLSLVATVVWRRYRERHPPVSDQPLLNKRGRQYVGRTFTLEHPIVNGVGKVVVDDSTWRVKGPDLPAGSKVRVADVDSVIFVVELVE